MKILLACTCMLCGGLVATAQNDGADAASKTTPPKAAPAARQTKKATALPPGVPKDAVETTPGFYRWTDKAGKAWTYRLSPFGVTRWPAESVDVAHEQARKDRAGTAQISAVEQGDSIRFEQVTPFGKHTWIRKKSELTESEQRIWAEQQKNSAAAHAPEKE